MQWTTDAARRTCQREQHSDSDYVILSDSLSADADFHIIPHSTKTHIHHEMIRSPGLSVHFILGDIFKIALCELRMRLAGLQ